MPTLPVLSILPGQLHAAAVFGAALLATLALASAFTPRAWWRRANARAMLVLGAGTWAIGSLFLWLGPASAPSNALAASVTPVPAAVMGHATAAAQPLPGQDYLVYRDLNLRAAATVSAPRLLVVPGGATVRATGQRQGDWWQVASNAAGARQTGWASSLWLRRGDEAATTVLAAPP